MTPPTRTDTDRALIARVIETGLSGTREVPTDEQDWCGECGNELVLIVDERDELVWWCGRCHHQIDYAPDLYDDVP